MVCKRIFRWTIGLVILVTVGSGSVAGASPLVKLDLSFDRDMLPAGQAQTAVMKVSLDVPAVPRQSERPFVNIAIALDRSGSMSGTKIERAREAAIEALRRLGTGDVFSLVAYDHEVTTLIPAQSASGAEWMEGTIRGVQARGNTALFGAVSQAAAEVRKNIGEPYVHRVILLSDGLANVGPSSPRDLARLGEALRKEGISVTTIGVGTDFNEDLMTALAERSDGNHYFVESGRDLPRIFASELGDVLTVAARRIILEIECRGGVRPLRVIGREGRIRGGRVEIELSQLYGGQEKYALVEVEVPEATANDEFEVARAQVSYENALSRRTETASAAGRIRFTASSEEVKKSANRAVHQAVLDNEMAEARDRALDFYKAGRKDEAARELRKTSQELQETNAGLGFSDLASEAGTLEEDAREFEAPVPLSEPKKKEIRSESFRIRSQQKEY